ncbi:MAG: PhzF family phenazine biosynthesis protein [Deltaproteobacteria bacterium]|nr:PhzF family phenazine biosynthesis protein [Deltaproteobacteria bacterium]
MDIPFYQIDAFTDRVFAGNPAGVCFLERWLKDNVLQSIAAENNVSETAFLVPAGTGYELRWFTPKVEVDLCGHATLASALAVFEFINPQIHQVEFQTRKSGLLSVSRQGDLLTMDFPARRPVPCLPPDGLDKILGLPPVQTFQSRDLMAVYKTEEQVRSLQPDMDKLAALDTFAVIVTAPGRNCDFVSRFFAPRVGVPEDPVTGSAHCSLIPYWSERLGKKNLHARQLSERGGELFCLDQGDRVSIGGRAVAYLSGTIRVGNI